jgi:hypothetical protein
MCTLQVPAGTTVAALLSGASPKLARLSGNSVRVLVNGEVAADPSQLLTHGDQVWPPVMHGARYGAVAC